MPEAPTPPESLVATVTPAQVLQRFERIRDGYRLGLYDLDAFNAALKFFQFPDEHGVIWTIGASSTQWYRWDGSAWQVGNPPGQLRMPPMPLELRPEGQAPVLSRAAEAVPAEPRALSCPKCGAKNIGKKFCTTCGAKLV